MVKRNVPVQRAGGDYLKDFASRTGIEDISDFVDIYLTCRKPAEI
jgi:hypothetical protein